MLKILINTNFYEEGQLESSAKVFLHGLSFFTCIISELNILYILSLDPRTQRDQKYNKCFQS